VRLLLTGDDEAGKSCLMSIADVTSEAVAAMPWIGVGRLFSTNIAPVTHPDPPDPALSGPGDVRWYLIEHAPLAPGENRPEPTLHRRDTIDLVVMLEGSGDLLLHDGAHAVAAGECFLLPGNDHAMRAGPGGCRLLSVSVGTPPAPTTRSAS
jgi:mannose-6-phosphate isomerase-like protein (cupin superfamily)